MHFYASHRRTIRERRTQHQLSPSLRPVVFYSAPTFLGADDRDTITVQYWAGRENPCRFLDEFVPRATRGDMLS